MKKINLILCLSVLLFACKKEPHVNTATDDIGVKVDSLLSLMTLEEKIGQMNQYNGFWNVTGPAPEEGPVVA